VAEYNDFIICVEEYFSEVKRLLRPGQKKVYRAMVAPYDMAHVKEAIEHFSRQTDRFPQANEFGMVLLNFATGGKEREQDIAERDWQCSACEETIVEYRVENRWLRFSDTGGLMYLEREEGWYAVRCWECGGPKRHGPHAKKHLPIPELHDRPHYRPESQTPLGEIRRAASEEIFRVGLQALLYRGDQPSFIDQAQAWEKQAIANTLQGQRDSAEVALGAAASESGSVQ
jgi:hypothetical protein